MADNWFVVRAGKELGPFTARQLREMAATRKLAPDDLVRRADMKEPRKASSIKGLLPEPVLPVAKPVEANVEQSENQREPHQSGSSRWFLSFQSGQFFLRAAAGWESWESSAFG